MFWTSRVVAPLALAIGMTAAAITLAQPPDWGRDGQRGEKGSPKDDRDGQRGGHERPDSAVEAWVKVLVEKVTDPHDIIRDSARAGLVEVGRPAIPALRKLVDGEDPAKAIAARKLIAAIDRTPAGDRNARPDGRGGLGRGRTAGQFPPMPPGPDGEGAGFPPPPPPPPPGRGEPPPENMGEAGRPTPLDRALGELDLTDEQKRKVDAVKDTYRKRSQEIFEKVRAGRIERPDIRAHVDRMLEEVSNELKEALTPEQTKRLEEIVPADRPLFPPPHPSGRPGGLDGPPGERPGPPAAQW